MIEAGLPVDEEDYLDETPLTVAAASGDLELVQLLLDNGASAATEDPYDSILHHAKNRETILLLLKAGADPSGLDTEGKRRLLGLGEATDAPIAELSRDEYLAGRYEREGTSNPEEITDAFRSAMIRSGGNAYWARKQFDDDPTFACGLSQEERPAQIWCFDRFGQSFTVLPDGRTILIAGEHEDYYDPDFCIYNDVTVFHPDGRIQVFGYPYSVFEPTDFHTATLIGDFIWIVGGLGYQGQRKGPFPVYRLDVRTYVIQRVETSGKVPPRIFRHRAEVNDGSLTIREGTAIQFKRRQENHEDNARAYRLDTATGVWTEAPAS
jgi:hypothetical protein